MIRIWQHIPN